MFTAKMRTSLSGSARIPVTWGASSSGISCRASITALRRAASSLRRKGSRPDDHRVGLEPDQYGEDRHAHARRALLVEAPAEQRHRLRKGPEFPHRARGAPPGPARRARASSCPMSAAGRSLARAPGRVRSGTGLAATELRNRRMRDGLIRAKTDLRWSGNARRLCRATTSCAAMAWLGSTTSGAAVLDEFSGMPNTIVLASSWAMVRPPPLRSRPSLRRHRRPFRSAGRRSSGRRHNCPARCHHAGRRWDATDGGVLCRQPAVAMMPDAASG